MFWLKIMKILFVITPYLSGVLNLSSNLIQLETVQYNLPIKIFK